MGISKKNKRKIIFQDQVFYWWINDVWDVYDGMTEINIITEDKAFFVRYDAIQDKKSIKQIAVTGKNFPGWNGKNGKWQKFICPDFLSASNNRGIGPKHIASILEWCFDPKRGGN